METRNQGLFDGLIFVKKGLGVHVQCMLEMSGVLYTGRKSKMFGKKSKGNLRSLIDKLTFWCQLVFLLKYIILSLLACLMPLHSENVD